MLDKNVIRVNGYKGTKRTHIDFVAKMEKISYTSDGRVYNLEVPRLMQDPVQLAFDNGLDAVTSINKYNCFAQKRITEKIY